MTKKEWLDIKEKHPTVLRKCREWFEAKYKSEWKEEMQDHEKLFEFFGATGIQIQTTRKKNMFGYSVACKGIMVNKGEMYSGLLEAEAEAIKLAFQYHENYNKQDDKNHQE